MDIVITVLVSILAIFIVILVLISPGIIARLLFRKTNEIKLRNITALIPAIVFYTRQIIKGDVDDIVNAFSTGFGSSNMAITISICLLLFLFTYIVHRFFVDMGIGLTDKLLKKKSQPKIEAYGKNTG